MNVDWAQAAFNLLGTGTVGGVVLVVIQALLDRKKRGAEAKRAAAEAEKVEADAADVLTARALTMVTKLEEQVTRTEDRLRAANGQVDELSRRLHWLIGAILAPDATLERLRAMVAPGSGINGRH